MTPDYTDSVCLQHLPFLKVNALSSGSFWLRLSGFLLAESFISGVREAQTAFPTGCKCSEHHRFLSSLEICWSSKSGIPSQGGVGRARPGGFVPSSSVGVGRMLRPSWLPWEPLHCSDIGL